MSVWPAWEVREDDRATSWFSVRLAFGDGARVDALAMVCEGCAALEDVRAQPALSLDDLAELADWIEEPLFRACGPGPDPTAGPDGSVPSRRARSGWPRGVEGRWLVAQKYRAAQEQGVDPVLAVMCATGHSRRKSLRLISQARDSGFLTPRHARR
ncbi:MULTISPECIES: DUF6214 family protein [unclassified Streptomyces]|uniref:DUF6214 family protein n=1 Tax=unclassified Streptomyces TaxID=2593676 RepID=UPI00225937FF|nr:MULTISPECIES: DUF6214 family protein [unclassified Streptomyces]MCX5053385.1 DUF6214 family protein [Streptomyces sp. NBC_00474]MCX5059346.1 DUF6214 family protein [Streptomyces sp. NBC_00452]MCX5244007.1 DUF6214 family protein [Streptomyces sp. NBC_00201]MCX5290259.1 DUF6214 family protein [Streptomyces sp. NBC_00183]